MKLFLKNNKLIFVSLISLTICVIIALFQYKIEYIKEVDRYNDVIIYLESNPDASSLIPKMPMMYDTYTLFSYIVVDSPLGIIMFVMPFILMLCGVYNFYAKTKSGFFKNEFMRRKYAKNMIKNVLDSWKSVIIIPLFIIIIFLGCYIVSGNFDINKTIEFYGYSLINRRYLNILPIYFIVYTINLILVGIFYINIAIIVAKKNSNLFVTLVQSYLIFIIVGIMTEVIVGTGLESLFPQLKAYYLANSLSIFNFWVYSNVMSLWFMFLFAFILFAISTIILFLKYRNKESVCLEIDK